MFAVNEIFVIYFLVSLAGQVFGRGMGVQRKGKNYIQVNIFVCLCIIATWICFVFMFDGLLLEFVVIFSHPVQLDNNIFKSFKVSVVGVCKVNS